MLRYVFCSMLIYYLQAIARSLKFTNNQLRMQLQTVGFCSYTTHFYILVLFDVICSN